MDKETNHLLPWHINGTLSGADRDRVEKALRTDAKAKSLYNWERMTQHAVKLDPELDVAADHGLARTMERIRAATPPPVVVPPAQVAHSAAAAEVEEAGWFTRFTRGFQWSPALAVACGLVAVQFAVITQLWPNRGEENSYAMERTLAAKAAANIAYIRVAFRPEATEAELRNAVRAVDADIVAGPSQLGEYYLVVAKAGASAAVATLQARRGVESVEVVDALPEKQ